MGYPDHSTLDERFADIVLKHDPPPDLGEGIFARTVGSALGQPTRLTRGTSGLSVEHRVRARDMAMEAAHLCVKNAAWIHYTQGRLRWSGISGNLRAWEGHFPRYADCSAFSTWCLWNGLDHFAVRDVVNGLGWRAGYTGTILTHGMRVQGEPLRGDLVVYGNRYPGRHVAVYIGGGLVISHGSEAGPLKLDMHYRRDLYQIRRFI